MLDEYLHVAYISHLRVVTVLRSLDISLAVRGLVSRFLTRHLDLESAPRRKGLAFARWRRCSASLTLTLTLALALILTLALTLNPNLTLTLTLTLTLIGGVIHG